MQPYGVILAGGPAARFGGCDKAQAVLDGRSLLAHVSGRLGPQVGTLALNTNGATETDLPKVPDTVSGFLGPMAGILAGLEWAAGHGGESIVTVPVDSPFLPCDLVPRLLLAAELAGADLAMARAGGQPHPTFGLWPIRLRQALRAELASGPRRVRPFAEAQGAGYADFPADGAFFNINTAADLACAEAMLRREG